MLSQFEPHQLKRCSKWRNRGGSGFTGTLIFKNIDTVYTQAPYQLLVMALVVSSNYALPEVTVSLLTYTYIYKHYFQKESIHTQLLMKWPNRKTNVKKKRHYQIILLFNSGFVDYFFVPIENFCCKSGLAALSNHSATRCMGIESRPNQKFKLDFVNSKCYNFSRTYK